MTDLETRLRDGLTRAAYDAPTAAGLAARVRARRRTRRTTTTAWSAGVLVAAVVALIAVVPGLLGSTGGEVGVSDSPSGERTLEGGWRTVTLSEGGRNRLEIDLPEDWPENGLFTYPADRRDRERAQGRVRAGIDSVVGQVLVGDTMISVDVRSAATVRRVLASARPGGTPAAEVTGWETETVSDEYGEVTAQVPDDPRVEVRLLDGFPDCEPGRSPAEPDGEGGWSATLCRDRVVVVDAPTQALADVVAATVRGY
ncbi:hypothetical protein [uncultured Nocardioides sp.]|uniref:hypothetical protein n=1 Tax=uncultured Nocardioides sp. TaxID=198441 RepID=UPI002605F796|nr:hypothetical protein [uncultured Nocardioides sp.]